MVVIRFSDPDSESRALGYLAGRFPFTTRSNGETLVPEVALAFLANESIPYFVAFKVRSDRHLDDHISD